ncbi:ABC transporter ATP-binding protein [Roseibium sp. RKSG952]|uniref:ABC transporter ATP-binding protein n=1 Tax=Roseibium sp. RKSG952 TaxID=2529384 RepID=UPI0012BBD1CB|nr:ABC transporter ATP-binding protein [Roseibium sp. RKSG952]MTI01297.1 ABC transporter ATP-binding protein [Roseibium sp. RKSG952]
MSIAHLLEDFTAQSDGAAVHLLDEDALEEQRLAAFENGYGAGWEDAIKAQEQQSGRLTDELARSLEDVSFTYHEAMTRMALSLEPMFQSLTSMILPEMVDRSFATQIVEQLCQMAQDQIGQPMQLVVPEGSSEAVQNLVPDALSPSPQVIEDPSLRPGQARLQVGTARRAVDNSALLSTIAQAFDAYLHEAKEALSNE